MFIIWNMEIYYNPQLKVIITEGGGIAFFLSQHNKALGILVFLFFHAYPSLYPALSMADRQGMPSFWRYPCNVLQKWKK